jgi:adenine-specific DNA-methyltransferase
MAKYDDYSKEQLIEEIKRLKQPKKFGLVWEEHTEEVIEQFKTNFPVLYEIPQRAICTENQPTNLIIEGDNYHALSVLNVTHKGKIDVIYIDPPYNTGARDWKYNNDFVDGQDSYKHSKWLSFMKKRLVIARELLKKEGIIIATIDDYEVAPLTLLINQIFGEDNHLGTVVIKNNPSGRSTTKGFAVAHEYALFYSFLPNAKICRLQRNDEQIARYKEKDEIGYYEWVNFRARYSTVAQTMQYPLFVKKDCSGFRIPTLIWNEIDKTHELLEEPKESELVKYPIDD